MQLDIDRLITHFGGPAALADALTRPGRPLLRRHLAGPLQIGGL